MEMQSVCTGITAPKLRLSANCLFSNEVVSASNVGLRCPRILLKPPSKLCVKPGLKNLSKGFSWSSLNRGAVICGSSSSNSNADTNLKISRRKGSGVPASSYNGVEPFNGKSGSVSFHGLTHQSVEEGRLVSAPFNEEKGSFVWFLGPVALVLSLIVPQFFLGSAIEAFLKDEVLGEIVTSLSFEAMFYFGLATFLTVTDRIQRPYLQFSSKRWGLITGLRGYLTSAFFVMGFKVIAPLFAVFVTWPVLGLPALVSVLPFLVGCLAQRLFETYLDKHGSSCWPLVPVIFEVYRLYQLTKAAYFIEKLMFTLRGAPESALLLERSNALVSMIVTFQVLGLVCLWSLLTFLLRLFPSRPVAENY
ncbi:hypothetical protein DKX38_020622 [Salix brachista]|uniref:Uncharacterized protein n=1 Tax=Salix brachista TaxID=2182728 RepID=A0A5N5KB07_9ROSI|nr:hypothetical protein DKX38_020622 [Salix brachista]